MYDDIEIPLPQQMTLEEIMRLPTPLRTLILRFRPEYDTDRERLQWIYRSYYGAISHIDREVGLILDTLETTGVADNTIVVFSSDHGDQLLEHGLMGKNCFFESSVRVPFIIRFPGHIRPAQYEELVESVDLLPTLFELAGLPEPYSNQGRSLAGLIVKNRSDYVARTAVFSENVIPEVIAGSDCSALAFTGTLITCHSYRSTRQDRRRRGANLRRPEYRSVPDRSHRRQAADIPLMLPASRSDSATSRPPRFAERWYACDGRYGRIHQLSAANFPG